MLIICPHLPRWPRLSSYYWLSVSSLVVNYLWFFKSSPWFVFSPLFPSARYEGSCRGHTPFLKEHLVWNWPGVDGKSAGRECQCSFCQPEASSVPCTLTRYQEVHAPPWNPVSALSEYTTQHSHCQLSNPSALSAFPDSYFLLSVHGLCKR